MSAIEITTSGAPPTHTPQYDPRTNPGISMHYESGAKRLYVGISKTGAPKWFYINHSSTLAAGSISSGVVPTSVPADIEVSASYSLPTENDTIIPHPTFIQMHVEYSDVGDYKLYMGVVNPLNTSQVIWTYFDSDGLY